jgi:hypothetical protein
MNPHLGYKIIGRLEDGRLRALTGTLPDYAPGVWVTPPSGWGPLSCFADRARALALAGEIRPQVPFELEVWSCLWLPWRLKLPFDKEGEKLALWDELGFVLKARELPKGTRLAKAICLTERV